MAYHLFIIRARMLRSGRDQASAVGSHLFFLHFCLRVGACNLTWPLLDRPLFTSVAATFRVIRSGADCIHQMENSS